MTYRSWERLARITKGINDWSTNAICFIIAVPVGIVLSPFAGIWYGGKWLYRHFHKEKEEVEEVKEVKPHITPKPNVGSFLFKRGSFLFKGDRALKVPYDKIAYVETEPDARIRKFFEKNKEWLRQWQEWYGIDIIFVDSNQIREGMVYPQDFYVFRHGFIWQMPISAGDGINDDERGDVAHYFELNTKDAQPLRKQMENFAAIVYRSVENHFL